jgi:hypothetical protein
MHPHPNHPFTTAHSSNSNYSNAPKTNTHTFSQPQFANHPFLSPQANQFPNNRNVYASTIQVSTSSNALNRPAAMGLGKLESMGRAIKEEPDPIVHRIHEAPSSFLAPPSN